MTQPLLVFCPVLHAHLPFVPLGEGDAAPTLEETWLFSATAECYLPLLAAFERLTEDRVPWSLAMSISPTLLAQWQHERFAARAHGFFAKVTNLAREVRASVPDGALADALDEHLAFLVKAGAALQRHGGDLAGAFRRFADLGHIELLASCATHAVLPLLADRPECVSAQVNAGIDVYRRTFGREVRGFWLPECAYAPQVEPYLAAAGVRYAFVDAHGVAEADPRPPHRTARPILSPGGVAFFGRDTRTAHQVWSAAEGFPGDPRYREFHSDLGFEVAPDLRERHGLGAYPGPLGLKLRRVTSRDRHGHGEAAKEPYDHESAQAAADEHAAAFVAGLAAAAESAPAAGEPPVCASFYDAELFGHWWFEGPQFLEAVFRRLADERRVAVQTPGGYLADSPECLVALPSVSSWGRGGYFAVWLDEHAEDLWPRQRDAAERLIRLCAPGRRAREDAAAALDQAARELLLAQSSDWPFMIAMDTTAGYARRRFDEHLHFVHEFCRSVEMGRIDGRLVSERTSRWAVLRGLDHRVYTPLQN